MDLDQIKPGDEFYHKATAKRCVALKINKDGTVKVRTSDDEERDYFPQELREPQSVIIKRRNIIG